LVSRLNVSVREWVRLAESTRKYTAEMVAEALREIGGLVLVFVPLDAMFAPRPLGWKGWVVSMSIGMGTLPVGIGIERSRVQ